MKGLVRVLGVIIVMMITYKGYMRVYTSLQAIDLVTCHRVNFDVRFSSSCKQKISHFIAHNPEFKKCPRVIHDTLLKSQCQGIANSSCCLNAQGVMHIEIQAQNPIAVVNKHLVVTELGNLIDSAIFVESILDQLPQLHITSAQLATHNLDLVCHEYIQKTPWHLLHNYSVNWQSPSKIVMTHTQNSLFSIMCSSEFEPTAALLKACDQIITVLDAQGQFKKKASKQWIADMRFKDQIVVYAFEHRSPHCLKTLGVPHANIDEFGVKKGRE